MKIFFIPFVILAVFSLLFVSCETEEAPEAAFSASEGSSTNTAITIDFSDISSNSPSEWYWTFEGGIPSTSTERNPSVTYTSPGTFDVILEVKNSGGSNQTTKIDYVNIAKFFNPTHTDIELTINSKTKTIPVDDYVLFSSIDHTNLTIDAETYGTTGLGYQIGLPISWEGTVDLNEYNAWNLNVNSDFVFFYMTNSGTDNLNPIYVNWGTNDETVDDIVIPNSGNTLPTGYYYANSGMEVRAGFENSSTEIYWQDGNHFFLSWEDNQYHNLGNINKSSREDNQGAKAGEPGAGNLYSTR
ncbi:MAG: PKD domain-containing protein [Bacteroidales bacterium]|jgi:PKD repeat protein|nr:PKD domain-containing protein [Bacteroidales bacterium]